MLISEWNFPLPLELPTLLLFLETAICWTNFPKTLVGSDKKILLLDKVNHLFRNQYILVLLGHSPLVLRGVDGGAGVGAGDLELSLPRCWWHREEDARSTLSVCKWKKWQERKIRSHFRLSFIFIRAFHPSGGKQTTCRRTQSRPIIYLPIGSQNIAQK